jgi:hypothetical protein
MEKIFAQSLTLPGGTEVNGPAGLSWATSVGAIVGQAINYVFAAAGIGLLLMLISSGFTFLTSAGDSKKMDAGKQRLTNALVGFVIIFAAYWIVQIAGVVLGISEIETIFPR